ncbi:hypothetical protein [Nocardia abscessus]|uniref:hypothetical protein n=1 Tax=Nocardia abscessus TaxID=120957 RepID=UPI001E62BC9E|nr:hypothetical protein [Nocardia abscessus]
MSKFNLARPGATAPITSETRPTGRTFEGGVGYARTPQSELFLLAVTNMVGEHTFYESAGERDDRYAALVRAATIAAPEWTARFLRWLRTEANMRSAAIVGAAEFAKARLDAGAAGMSRQVVDSVLQRADEPGNCSPTGPRCTGAPCPSRSSAASPTRYAGCTTSAPCSSGTVPREPSGSPTCCS